MSSGICEQGRPKSVCASVQSDQGFRCPLTESLVSTECMNGERSSECYIAHAQDDLNPCIMRMIKGTISLDVAHVIGRSNEHI